MDSARCTKHLFYWIISLASDHVPPHYTLDRSSMNLLHPDPRSAYTLVRPFFNIPDKSVQLVLISRSYSATVAFICTVLLPAIAKDLSLFAKIIESCHICPMQSAKLFGSSFLGASSAIIARFVSSCSAQNLSRSSMRALGASLPVPIQHTILYRAIRADECVMPCGIEVLSASADDHVI